jgi:hypothetical protein
MSQHPPGRPLSSHGDREAEETRLGAPLPSLERRGFGRIDREHPLGGEMSDILRGILLRVRLPWLLAHHSQVVVLALFSFITGRFSLPWNAGIASKPDRFSTNAWTCAIRALSGSAWPIQHSSFEP